jgi:hypothetical protein
MSISRLKEVVQFGKHARMGAQIICVHGIGQQLKGEETLLTEWIPAMRDGIKDAGGPKVREDEVAMAFYGDLFRRKGTKAFGIPPYDETDVSQGIEQELLSELWQGGAAIDPAVTGPGAETKLYAPRFVERALNALSHSRFFAGLAMNAFIADLKQVSSYLRDEELRKGVQSRIAEAVTDQARVVIAHSLGTVAAYEALCAHPEWPVRAFISLGSPLGIQNVIFDRLRPSPQDGIGVWPAGISMWTNIAAQGDIVALEKNLRNLFGERVQDFLISNEAHAHDVVPYFTARETGEAIKSGLQHA